MKKEKVEESQTANIAKEIKGILDDNYFYINIRLNEMFRGGIEWSVYYKNVNSKLYFSNKNKPLLTSKYNTIADIYILRDIFQKLQGRIISEEGFGFFENNRTIYCLFREMKEISSLKIVNIFTMYTLVNITTGLISRNVLVSCINLAVCIVAGIFVLYSNKKLNDLVKNTTKESQDILLKNLIRGKGLNFVKEIRNELYKEGVYKYGFNKKTRKAFNKSV